MSDAVRSWALTHGLRVLAVILAVLLVRALLRRAVPLGLRHSLVRGIDEEIRVEQIKRAETLSGVILTTSLIGLLLAGGFLVLGDLGFSVAPVVAGLGVTGIALGLGAQTLVKDAVNGIFILAENQFRRGDIVTIAGATGRVEDVSLRRTLLRAENGTVFSVPNSAITVAANHTRGYSGISLNLGLSLAADLERATDEINRIGMELARDPQLGHLVLDPPAALGATSPDDASLSIVVSGRVAPTAGAQAVVGGEMRRRIHQEFDRLGILYQISPAATDGTGKEIAG